MHEPAALAAVSVSARPGINLEIEYLRAVAVLLVFFVHADALFPGLAFGQWTGVDLFFCISGYVISRAFEDFFDRHIDEGRWWAAARAFWVRRIFRLAPSAWFWLAVNVLCAWKFNPAFWFGTLEQSWQTAVYFLMLSTNFALAHGSVSANGYFWSLTLEDQFYFLFPFFLLLFSGRWRWQMLLLLIFLQALPDRSLASSGTFPSYLWVMRLDALMWGILIHEFSRSAIYARLAPTLLRFRFGAFAVNAALIYLLVTVPKGTFGFLIHGRIESAVALASAGLVFLASFDRGYVLPLPGPLKKLMAWIGARSYGIYLIHLPLFGIVQEIWLRYAHLLGKPAPDPRIFYALAVLLLLPLLAELNFRLIETPLRHWGVSIANKILAKRSAAPAIAPVT